jgi:L-fuconolactonase
LRPQQITDAHVHLYDPARIPYAWMRAVPLLDRPHLPAEFAAAVAPLDVERLVFVEVAADQGAQRDEAAFVAQLAAAEPRLGAIVAHAPVEQGAAVATELDALQAISPLVVGVRRLIQDEPDPRFCIRPAFVEGVQAVGAAGLSFDLCIYHPQLPAVIELVAACPQVRFVLDHIGKPGIRAGLVEPWATQLRELASLPNVWCKLSGVVTEADHRAWTEAQLRPYLEHAVACFGLERLMFGSDWPVANLTHRYGDWVAILDRLLAGQDPALLERFWRTNARELYRIR